MAIIKKYKSVVEKIENPIPGIYTIQFSTNKKFKFAPGQFLHLAIDQYDGIDQWPESRCFSIQSPNNNSSLKITFSVKGNFTQRMSTELVEGREVWLKLPYGEIFSNSHSKDNVVFIAGGTGITPFLSLFTDETFKYYSFPKLYVGYKTREYNIFKKELDCARGNNRELSIMEYYEDIEGILDIESIYNECGNTTYFISGPPIMIKKFKQYLLDKSNNKCNIITDDWE